MKLIHKAKEIKDKLTHRPVYVKVSYVGDRRQFAGKKALVIGGTSGIGLAIAKRLQKSGCEVVICGRKDPHENLNFFPWDISDIGNIRAMFKKITEKLEKVDLVINSQGLNPENDLKQEYMKIDQEDFESVFRVNVESVYFICLAVYEYFKKENIQGHILNICSTEGFRAGVVPYSISKASTISLTKGFGREFAKDGITVNGIAPGTTATKMIYADKDLANSTQFTGRMNTSEEVANLAVLLLGDAGSQMCGEVVTIDGASLLR